MSDSVELKGVVETLMIPLWARALATQQQGLIDDPAAVDLVKRLEYDFDAKLGHARWLASFSVVRARRFDEAVRDFIDKYPDSAVVEIGCGLDTRWERCDGQRVDWFALDLDAAIALRQRYFRDGECRKMIAAPLQDAGWHDRVGPRDRPILFVSEGVLLYLEPDEVAEFIRSVSRSYGCGLCCDRGAPRGGREGGRARREGRRHSLARGAARALLLLDCRQRGHRRTGERGWLRRGHGRTVRGEARPGQHRSRAGGTCACGSPAATHILRPRRRKARSFQRVRRQRLAEVCVGGHDAADNA